MFSTQHHPGDPWNNHHLNPNTLGLTRPSVHIQSHHFDNLKAYADWWQEIQSWSVIFHSMSLNLPYQVILGILRAAVMFPQISPDLCSSQWYTAKCHSVVAQEFNRTATLSGPNRTGTQNLHWRENSFSLLGGRGPTLGFWSIMVVWYSMIKVLDAYI